MLLLRRLGLKRLGDLSGVGRESLARRFRNHRAPAVIELVAAGETTLEELNRVTLHG